jgi:hypothetical protein
MAKVNSIVRLSLVVRYGRSYIFIGWNENGAPGSASYLSDEAMIDFQSAKESGAEFPSVSTSDINCFEFSSLGKGIDYPGRNEDVIPVNAKDENNKAVVLNLGESTMLTAIEWALKDKNVWNSLAGMNQVDDGSGISSTTSMYTLLFQDNRVMNGAACALIFKPFVSASNENTFFRFVKAVIKQLLVIDESQPASNRKGYITVAAKASNASNKTSLADIFFDTSDVKTAKTLGKAKAGGLKILQALKIVEVSDELINEIKDPLPSYNVDTLDHKGLLDLVSAMKVLAPNRNRP